VLDGYLQPRVVDKTGLTGKYTFILEYRDAGPAMIAQRVKSQSADISGNSRLLEELAASEEGGGADIVSAIQKQLGLRLDKTKGVPLEAIIVDSVDKIPTEN